MGDSLTDQEINNTYSGLIKTIDSLELPSTGRTCLSDGQGSESSLEIGLCGEGAKIKGSVNVTGNITQSDAACTSTLGVVNICGTLNAASDACLEGNFTVNGDTCTNGNNCLGTPETLTCIQGDLIVGGSQAPSSRITSTPFNSNESGLTICGSNISPYMRFCESINSATYSVGLDITDNSNFKIATGNTVNGANNLVVRASGRVNINSNTGNDNLTVGGTGLFTSNLTTNGNFNLKLGGLCATNGLGSVGNILQSTGSKIVWAAPSGGATCEGTVCGTGTGTKVPKWSNSSTLVDSTISENGGAVNIANSLSVDCNTTVNGYLKLDSVLRDSVNLPGSNGQILESTGSGVQWVTSSGKNCTGNISGPTGGGTTNTISKFTGPGGVGIGDSVITELDDNIGIGATPGLSKLTVGGSIVGSDFIGNLNGNICGSTTIECNLTVNAQATIASARIDGILKDNDGNTGSSGQVLRSIGTGIEWFSLPASSNCSGSVGGTGTTDTLTKWTNGTGTIGDSVIKEASNNIGIGIAPDNTYKLKVGGVVCAEIFDGDVIGNLSGNITGNTTVGGQITVGGDTNGNTVITSDGNILTNDITAAGNTTVNGYLKVNSVLRDCNNGAGLNGQILQSTCTGVRWITSSGTSCTGNIGGSGTVNTLSKFTGGTAMGDSIIKEASNNIGIGVTPTASHKLSIGGTVCATRFNGPVTGDLTGNITGNTTVGGSITVGSNTNGNTVITSDGDILTQDITAAGSICTLGSITATGIIYGKNDIIAFSTSDERLKDNITCISDSNNIINSLNGYCFDWNDKSDREGSGIGLIAQEVQKVLPNAVCERDNGYLAVDYIQLIPVMVEELKRLNQIVSKLESQS